ncbi:hypothetical protein PLICRDRAFT_165512 [Plicaturopsis crispa FD-325 SS-3]|nr:hypothetical protein PLICRDRAFT_165512 [Plicaturopsis crispa FD-325 SS-3]
MSELLEKEWKTQTPIDAEAPDPGTPTSKSLDEGADADEVPQVDPRVRRKVDWNVLPLVAILYLCSFLYVPSISRNARVAGMATELHLTGTRYQLAAAVFFIPYSILEVPCNVIMKLMTPSTWIAGIMVAWGVVMLSMAFVKNYHGLLIARIFLGVTEAGLAPAVAYYVTLWYRKKDQARPFALYWSNATVAGAFGGLLAFAIEKMDGIGGLRGWAWIFLLEGLMTVAFAVLAYWKLPDSPETAKFLTPAEKAHLLDVLRRDTTGEPFRFEWRFVWETLRDPLSWTLCVIYAGQLMTVYSVALFLPTIISDLGISKPSDVQLFTIPPYAAGCATTMLLGVLSDRAHMRGPFVMGTTLLGIIGYALLLSTSPSDLPGVGYAGTVLATCGSFPTIPLLLAWAAGNAGGNVKKGIIVGMLSSCGNVGGIVGSFIYRTQDTPRYRLGHGFVLGCLCLAFLTTGFAMYNFDRLNKQKARRCREEGIGKERRAEFAGMGTGSPLFRCVVFRWAGGGERVE